MSSQKLKTSLAWDIKVQPLFTITNQSTSAKAIMRNDDNRILGIVSEKYKAFTNREHLKLCRSVEKIGPFKIEGFTELQKGKTVLAFLRNNQPDLKLAGLDVKEYLVIGNSHDGSRKMFVGSSQTLVRCENQFYAIVPFMWAKHIHGVSVQNDFVNGIRTQYEAGRKQLYTQLETLSAKKVNHELVEDLLLYLLHSDKIDASYSKKKEILQSDAALNLLRCIEKETADLGHNAFGLFNGVTWYTTHAMRRNKDNFGNTSGLAQELNAKALEFCLQL